MLYCIYSIYSIYSIGEENALPITTSHHQSAVQFYQLWSIVSALMLLLLLLLLLLLED